MNDMIAALEAAPKIACPLTKEQLDGLAATVAKEIGPQIYDSANIEQEPI